jgi:O-antigen/teichoic acid export membrane protein
MAETLTQRTVRGMKWSYVSTFVNAGLQIGFSAVLARLLDPLAFGLVAMAGVVLRFGSYFAQMGVGSALIQKETLDLREIHAAFLLSTGLGGAFALGMWVVAPVVAQLFDEPLLVDIVRVLSVTFLGTGLATSALSLLRRRLDFRTLSVIEIGSYVIGYGVVGVPMAVSGYGVWSLVAAVITQNGLTALLSHIAVRHGVGWVGDSAAYRHFWSFGSRVSIVGFFEFLGSSLDTITIGRFIGAAPLGLYNRAQMLVSVPINKLSGGMARVLLPSFSRVQSRPGRLRRVYVSALLLAGAVLMPMCAGLGVVAHDAVLLVLGDQWTGAVPVLQVLAMAVSLNVLTHLAAIACEATAQLNVKVLIQAVHIALQVVLFYVLSVYGIVGIATGFLIAEIVRHGAYAATMMHRLDVPLRDLMTAYGPAVVHSIGVGVTVYGVSRGLAHVDVGLAVRFGLEVLTGAVVLVGLILYGPSPRVRDALADVLRRLEHPLATRLLATISPPSSPVPPGEVQP